MSIDCPISNEFLPAIQKLADKYGSQGVQFLGIDPNASETLAEMAEYARQHKLSFPFLRDDDAKISRRLLFSVTPEARVFDRQGKIVYRGRIDDRYRAGGAAFRASRNCPKRSTNCWPASRSANQTPVPWAARFNYRNLRDPRPLWARRTKPTTRPARARGSSHMA